MALSPQTFMNTMVDNFVPGYLKNGYNMVVGGLSSASGRSEEQTSSTLLGFIPEPIRNFFSQAKEMVMGWIHKGLSAIGMGGDEPPAPAAPTKPASTPAATASLQPSATPPVPGKARGIG